MINRFTPLAVLSGLVVLLAAGSGLAHPAATVPGMLSFAAELDVTYPSVNCAAGTPTSIECFARTGTGMIRGLGTVTESFAYSVDPSPAGCDRDMIRVLPTTARLSVAGKGELELRIDGSGCVPRVPPQPVRAEANFTITGGSGIYAGATGAGRYGDLSYGPPAWRGRDTWTGTLVAPTLNFDLTPPQVTGATSRTASAPRNRKRVRVSYAVTARDDVDGARPVTCRPSSGSWFVLGRTRVQCSASDTSGNESTATFSITVKRRK